MAEINEKRSCVWRASLVLLAIVYGAAAAAQDPQTRTAQSISRDVDRVMDAAGMEPHARLTLARKARASAKTHHPDNPRLNAAACYSEAFALYLNGELVFDPLSECSYSGLRAQDMPLFVKMSSLRAWMFLVNGDIDQSVAAYETLLDEDLAGIGRVLRLRVNASYATALHHNGQALASIERFQRALIEAEELESEPAVVAAGNNLVVVLIERGMYQAAQAWYERLKPTMASVPRSHYTDSLELHGLQLMGELEDPAVAAVALRKFIDERPDAVSNIIGNAYEFMAGFLSRTGRHSEALDAANQALATLATQPLELTDARLTLAEVLIERGDFDQAVAELAETSDMAGRSPSHIERSHALMVKARLGRLGPQGQQILDTFNDFDELRGRREREQTEQNTRYFDSVRELQVQQTELQRYELDRVRLEIAAATSAVVASEQRALAQAERRARRLSVVVAILATGGGLLLLAHRNRRRIDRELQRQAEKMNAQLQEEVQEKSIALRKQLGDQAALERSLAETRHNEVIGRITGNVAHDFNNLLQIISLSTERLSALRESDQERSLFEGTKAALEHARSIIRQLLAYARRQKLRPEPLRFDGYLEQTEALFRVAVDDRIEFEVTDASQGACIVIDSAQFTTILLNLLSNACDAMPSGGTLKLAARFESLTGGAPPWTNLASGDYLIIEVTDTGIGMNERTLRRAFEPFYTDRAVGKGTGLGLSSVYGFVKQSRGDVRIDSKEGVGTSILMVFPATRDLQPNRATSDAEASELDGLRCLIVEDNKALARALCIMFEARGAATAVAMSAEEARARLENDTGYDLVITDVRMKGEYDGYELRDWLRGTRPHVPVLLMTGFVDEQRRTQDACIIHKPFTERELMQAIEIVLDRHPGQVAEVAPD